MTNLPNRLVRRAALAVSILASSVPSTAAPAGWSFADQRAGLSARGGGETIGFTCAGMAPGSLRLVLSGFDARLLQIDRDYTVVVTVDGTAYRRTLRATAAAAGWRDLARTERIADLGPLLEALAAGAKAEIASPAGREPLSLKGSGKALKALRAACS